MNAVIKKLQLKDQGKPVLILNAPEEYCEIISEFDTETQTEINEKKYHFVQVFGKSMAELKDLAVKAVSVVEEDGLLWLCYPKKSSKKYKGSDCSRDVVIYIFQDEGYEPVRQISIDDDWSALRFRQVDKIKTMNRKSAVTEKGKERIKSKGVK